MIVHETAADDIDIHYIKELYLADISDGNLYKNYALSCISNLRRKLSKGIFDSSKAPDIFIHGYLTAAIDYYRKETGFKQSLSRKEKRLFGELVFDYYREEIAKHDPNSNSSRVIFACTICFNKFYTQEELNDHFNEKHEQERERMQWN